MGNLRYTPPLNQSNNGLASFRFQVQDDGGTAAGGVDLALASNLITINVTPVNDSPSGADKTVSTAEDVAYTFTANDFGFSDPSDSPVNNLLAVRITTLPLVGTLTITSGPNAGPVGTGQFVAKTDIDAGRLTYLGAANANGTPLASFTFQVQDDGTTANGGIDLDPSPNTMVVNVSSVNDAPIGTTKSISLNEDVAYTFSAGDFGFADSNDNPANAFSAVLFTTLPASGTLFNGASAVNTTTPVSITAINNGALRFVPAAGQSGTAQIGFKVQDNGGTAGGGQDTDQTAKTLTMTVSAVNDAPVAVNSAVTTLEDTSITLHGSDFGFSDPNDAPSPNTLAAVRIASLPATARCSSAAAPSTSARSSPRPTWAITCWSSGRTPTPLAQATATSRSRSRITAARSMAASISRPTPPR